MSFHKVRRSESSLGLTFAGLTFAGLTFAADCDGGNDVEMYLRADEDSRFVSSSIWPVIRLGRLVLEAPFLG